MNINVSRKLYLCCYIGLIVTITSLFSSCAHIKTKPSEIIPKGFGTYTLFFNTSYEYTDKTAPNKLNILKRNFERFGNSIGSNNLAVWLREPDSEQLSVSRGIYYADVFSKWTDESLEYSDGPYMIISNTHPDYFMNTQLQQDPNQEPIVIAVGFNNISEDRIINILNFMEARIRRSQLHPTSIKLKILWVKMQSWLDDKEVREFLKGVFFRLIEKI